MSHWVACSALSPSEPASAPQVASRPACETRVKRQDRPRATARLVTSPTLQYRTAEAGRSTPPSAPSGSDRRGLAGQRADHREGGEVDAERLEPGAAQRLEKAGDHVSPRGDDDHVDLRRLPLLGRHAADHLVLEHRLVERHRHLLLRLEAHRRLHLLRILDRRQANGAHDDPLVADAEPHALAQLVLGEELLQPRDEPLGVLHLALVEGARLERSDRRCDHLEPSR